MKGKGLENLMTGKKSTTFDQNAFVTPMGTRFLALPGVNEIAKLTGWQVRVQEHLLV